MKRKLIYPNHCEEKKTADPLEATNFSVLPFPPEHERRALLVHG